MVDIRNAVRSERPPTEPKSRDEVPFGIWRPSKYRPRATAKKAGKLSQKEQSERFKETARELEANESGMSFEGSLITLSGPAARTSF